jgi:hypothetical protein
MGSKCPCVKAYEAEEKARKGLEQAKAKGKKVLEAQDQLTIGTPNLPLISSRQVSLNSNAVLHVRHYDSPGTLRAYHTDVQGRTHCLQAATSCRFPQGLSAVRNLPSQAGQGTCVLSFDIMTQVFGLCAERSIVCRRATLSGKTRLQPSRRDCNNVVLIRMARHCKSAFMQTDLLSFAESQGKNHTTQHKTIQHKTIQT